MDLFPVKKSTTALTGKFLIDSNVLIYATQSLDSRHSKSLEILEWGRHSKSKAYISVQNLAEMYPVLTGPKSIPPDSPEIARQKIESIASLPHLEIIPITWSIVTKALGLCQRHRIERQKYFDMQLVAMMLLHEIPTIVTENENDFSSIADIHVFHPF